MRFLDGAFYYSTSWWKVWWMPVIRRLLNLFFFNFVLQFFLFLHIHQWNRWSWLGIFEDNIFLLLLLLPSTFLELRWASLILLTIGLTGSLLPLLIMVRRTTPAWTTWFLLSVGLRPTWGTRPFLVTHRVILLNFPICMTHFAWLIP